MANQFTTIIDTYFEKVVENFDAMNMTVNKVARFKPNAGDLALSAQTFYRPQAHMTEVVDGLDMTGLYKNVVERAVPTSLTNAHIRNVPLSFANYDLNHPHQMDRAVKAANIMLSNKLDTLTANAIADKASLAVITAGSADTYDELSEADTLMLEQQCTNGMRTMLLNPRMAKGIAGNLAARETINELPRSALERNALPPIAGFDTYKVDYMKTLAGSAASGYLINGANQAHTPVSKDANGIPVDNRTQTLTVDGGSNIAVGDVFTIAGVYAVGHINKQATPKLKTFRVLAVNGADWTIAPAIVPADGAAQAQRDYANVDTTPADNAQITVLNTVKSACSVFFEESAIELIHSDYNTDAFAADGKKVRKATTDSGVQIIMLSDSNIDDLSAKYRMFVWANVNVLDYEMAGIILENQT